MRAPLTNLTRFHLCENTGGVAIVTAPAAQKTKTKTKTFGEVDKEPRFEARVYGKKLAAKGYRISARSHRASPGGRPAS